MPTILHSAASRGSADHGWLQTHHTFSFADYVDPERMGFGALRVLNDDVVAGGQGFPEHPHANMEIVTIPLEGALAHRDSMGNESVIRAGEVQVMSAGTGVTHSEYNASEEKPVKLLQIWIQPARQNIPPRYDQKKFDPLYRHNRLQIVVSPEHDDTKALQINQDTYFALGDLDAEREINYEIHHPSHGIYLFVIKGKLEVLGEILEERDGLGITATTHLRLKSLAQSEVLLIEVPMNF